MGLSSGLKLFLPLMGGLLKTSLEARQWGLFLIYLSSFITFTIIQLLCLLFTWNTVSTHFKNYAKKEPEKAQKVVDTLVKSFNDIQEHFFKRLGEKRN